MEFDLGYARDVIRGEGEGVGSVVRIVEESFAGAECG